MSGHQLLEKAEELVVGMVDLYDEDMSNIGPVFAFFVECFYEHADSDNDFKHMLLLLRHEIDMAIHIGV